MQCVNKNSYLSSLSCNPLHTGFQGFTRDERHPHKILQPMCHRNGRRVLRIWQGKAFNRTNFDINSRSGLTGLPHVPLCCSKWLRCLNAFFVQKCTQPVCALRKLQGVTVRLNSMTCLEDYTSIWALEGPAVYVNLIFECLVE